MALKDPFGFDFLEGPSASVFVRAHIRNAGPVESCLKRTVLPPFAVKSKEGQINPGKELLGTLGVAGVNGNNRDLGTFEGLSDSTA